MKALVDAKNRREADAIKAGLEDPMTRAVVVVLGALSQLPSDRTRKRVLQFVLDHFDERTQDAPEVKMP